MAIRRLGVGVEQVFVPLARQQAVLGIVAQRRIRGHAFGREGGVVSVYAVDHAVGSEGELVAAASDPTRGGAEQFYFLKLIVAMDVAKAIEALRIVGIHVERVVGEEQAAALEQIGI